MRVSAGERECERENVSSREKMRVRELERERICQSMRVRELERV